MLPFRTFRLSNILTVTVPLFGFSFYLFAGQPWSHLQKCWNDNTWEIPQCYSMRNACTSTNLTSLLQPRDTILRDYYSLTGSRITNWIFTCEIGRDWSVNRHYIDADSRYSRIVVVTLWCCGPCIRLTSLFAFVSTWRYRDPLMKPWPHKSFKQRR